jgi:hypothetical protein
VAQATASMEDLAREKLFYLNQQVIDSASIQRSTDCHHSAQFGDAPKYAPRVI